jgi:hypothetical protein
MRSEAEIKRKIEELRTCVLARYANWEKLDERIYTLEWVLGDDK